MSTQPDAADVAGALELRPGAADEAAQLDEPRVRLAPAREPEQVADDGLDAHRLAEDVVQAPLEVVRAGVPGLFQQALGGGVDVAQRVVQLVGDAGGQRPDRRELLALEQLLLPGEQLLLHGVEGPDQRLHLVGPAGARGDGQGREVPGPGPLDDGRQQAQALHDAAGDEEQGAEADHDEEGEDDEDGGARDGDGFLDAGAGVLVDRLGRAEDALPALAQGGDARLELAQHGDEPLVLPQPERLCR